MTLFQERKKKVWRINWDTNENIKIILYFKNFLINVSTAPMTFEMRHF